MADRARQTRAETHHAPQAFKTKAIAHPADRLVTYEMNVTLPALPTMPALLVSPPPAVAMPSVTAISCDQTWSGVICSIDNWIIRNKSNEEALSFCATILLAAVGWAALMVAFGQSNHAKKARLADTLIGLSKSLDAILPLQDSVDACLSALNANTMEEQKKAIVGVWDGTITYPFREDVIDSIDTLLAFFEDVGQLCRRGYVSQKDIFDLMGATLLLTLEQSLEYIENVRQVNDRNTYYSNVLWIYRRARSAPRFAVYGHGLQVPRLRTRLLASVRYRFSFLGL